MKRVAFYIHTEWALGSIHYALCKELYKFGIDADVLDWNKYYSPENFSEFKKVYDLFVTLPGQPLNILFNTYMVPPEKTVIVAHGKYDIDHALATNTNLAPFSKFGVVATSLKTHAESLGIKNKIKVVRNGIQFDRFYSKPATQLLNIGYAGIIKQFTHGQKELKRSHLVKAISDNTSLPIKMASGKHFTTMPNFYKDVDCVMVSSDENESCGLPLMEAAAAGRLPISAKVGITCEFDNPPGIILPMDEEGFVSHGTQILNELKQDTNKFTSLCADAQDFARQHYDWSAVIEDWADLILS